MEVKPNDILAHDLRTPLTTIKGYASMLAEEAYGPLDDESKEAVKKIISAIDEMSKMINDKLQN